jgi:rare lipoprotein A
MLRRSFVALFAAYVCCLAFVDSADARSTTASWYGPGLAGNPTANGERFDPGAHTAAHRTLPMGTRLTVCHEGCVDVRVNDRGPHIANREIDLSAAAANKIGVQRKGLAPVEVYGA